MIKVTVEMWPGGSEVGKYSLFDMTLSNIGGDATHGDYRAKLFRRPPQGKHADVMRDKPLRSCIVRGHPRQRVHLAVLVGNALAVMYPSTPEKKKRMRKRLK